jgi:pyridinium-3,5-bisthiocarboxylic acid mononucleotide nickel chelatase
MFLGALLDAGVPLEVLEGATAALGVGASLKVEQVDRSGIACTKVHVLEGTALEGQSAVLEQGATSGYTMQPKTQHLHKGGHAHSHGPHTHDEAHTHSHGRSLSVIRALIQEAALAGPVKRTAIKAFELLGHAEAKIHNVPVEEIHFHEVGAVDAIVDIVAASAGIHHLRIGAWFCSPLNVGGGMVECAHGTFPVPAPAAAELLRGMPTYSAHVQKELVTPTGAALVRALDPVFGQQPAMQVEQIGYGAGTRNPVGFPNVLRLSVGESAEESASETVTVLETALDDLSPQVLAHVAERALAEGALDVMLTPVIMKKGRPGTLLTVLCNAAERAGLEALILRETSTLGIRVREERRVVLERSHATVRTEYGEIRVKLGSRGGEVLNVAPEFEDCRTAAARGDVAVKTVQQAAIAAYLGRA